MAKFGFERFSSVGTWLVTLLVVEVAIGNKGDGLRQLSCDIERDPKLLQQEPGKEAETDSRAIR